MRRLKDGPPRKMKPVSSRQSCTSNHVLSYETLLQHVKSQESTLCSTCSLPMTAGQCMISCIGLTSPSMVATVVATHAVP